MVPPARRRCRSCTPSGTSIPPGAPEESWRAPTWPSGVRYVNETAPGLAAVRNRALDEAGNANLLAFIDDDETPAAGWLQHLVRTWRATGRRR
ncbi:glycosyltransferase family 2 protein [Luteococcus japonicus]|uniref:glycosyltransferase family 2 protein n=1 Tax=Luteococcus japonicus TaxID=33984 RepID=UPI003CCC66F4